MGSEAVEAMPTVGGMLSKLRLNWAAAVFPLFAEFWATPSAMSAVTCPGAVGARSKV